VALGRARPVNPSLGGRDSKIIPQYNLWSMTCSSYVARMCGSIATMGFSMRNICLFRPSLVAVVMTLHVGGVAFAGIINVPADEPTIQAAILSAGIGDEIIVAQGTYFENIDFIGKAIIVRSSDPTNPAVVALTIIDAGNSGRGVTFSNGESSNTLFGGFTITNGDETNGGGIFCQNTSPTISNCVLNRNSATISGGGMYNSLGASPTITNCSFTNNTANNGAGMFNSQSHPTVINCKFTTNVSAFGGGGMFNSDSSPDVVGCTFLANSANGAIGVVAGGGGMLNINLAGQDSNPTVTNCEFLANVAVLNGGGMLNHIGSNPLVSGCVFNGNMADGNGGGMINTFESLTFPGMNSSVTNCVFNRNFAGISGGGMFIEPLAQATVTNCQFTGNTAVVAGGGIFCSVPIDFDVRVTNCTFYENTASVGGGMAIDDGVKGALVTGSIFWNDHPDAIDILNGTSSAISACIIQGALPAGSIGGGNIDADPKFVDAVGVDGIAGTLDDDLRLLPGSPGIDAGRNPQIRPDVSDVDDDGDVTEPIPLDLHGSPRFVDDPATMNTGFGSICPICSGGPLSKSDIGAFEYLPGDGDRDGDTDLEDNEMFSACLVGPDGGVPTECLAFDMNGDGQVDLLDWRIFQKVFIDLP